MPTKKKVRPRFPVVEVVWDDAITHGSVTKVIDLLTLTLAERHTVGYLLMENEHVVMVSHFYDLVVDGEDTVEEITVIPTGWVKSITPFTIRRPNAKSVLSIGGPVRGVRPKRGLDTQGTDNQNLPECEGPLPSGEVRGKVPGGE